MAVNLKIFSHSGKIKGKTHDTQAFIMEEMRNVNKQLTQAYSEFEYASDTDLIDSAIFEVNSLIARYRYLIKLAKDENLSSPSIGSFWEAEERVS